MRPKKFNCSDELSKKLQLIAAESGESESFVIRQLLESALSGDHLYINLAKNYLDFPENKR